MEPSVKQSDTCPVFFANYMHLRKSPHILAVFFSHSLYANGEESTWWNIAPSAAETAPLGRCLMVLDLQNLWSVSRDGCFIHHGISVLIYLSLYLFIHVILLIIWHGYLLCYTQNSCWRSVMLLSQKTVISVFISSTQYIRTKTCPAISSYFKLKILSTMQTARVRSHETVIVQNVLSLKWLIKRNWENFIRGRRVFHTTRTILRKFRLRPNKMINLLGRCRLIWSRKLLRLFQVRVPPVRIIFSLSRFKRELTKLSDF
jgi:hypothetical protein